MSYSNENIQKASKVFFYLLKNKIVSINDSLGNEYIENLEVREIVKTMADEGGLIVFHVGGNIHLVIPWWGRSGIFFIKDIFVHPSP